METCGVTFDETQPCSYAVFECADDDEIGEKIFEDEKDDYGEDDGDPPAAHVPSTSTTMTTIHDGPSPTLIVTHQDRVKASLEEEVVSR
jgi:hypothetical protein